MKLPSKKVLLGGGLFASLFIGSYLAYAAVTQAGYCWNDKVGWINMANVDYDSSTRKFSGIATYYEGILSGGSFGNGEIDFTEQGSTSLLVDLSTTADGSGNFPLEGQAFSNQIGWVFADHGGTDPASMTPAGNLVGNFWNNVIGWIMCSGTDVGAGNDQIWATTSSAGTPGGVSAGLEFWLKADAGTLVAPGNSWAANNDATADWEDQSGNDRHVDAVTGTPELQISGLNFNPVVDWDGVTEFMRDDSAGTWYTGFTEGETFFVAQQDNIGSDIGFPQHLGSGQSAPTDRYTFTDGGVYHRFGTDVRQGWNPATNTVLQNDGTASGPVVDTGDYNIYNAYSATNDWAAHFNGALSYADSTNVVDFSYNANGITIGAKPGQLFDGRVPEHIMYSRKLTSTERQRVDSYLALKYGITLDQTSSTNYLASDGTTDVWDAGQNVNYKFDVAGIGQDDDSTLDQKISKSVNDDALVTMATTNNFTLPNTDGSRTSLGDGNFLTWSNNDGGTVWTTTGAPTNRRVINRKWQAQETGTVGSVFVRVPASTATEASKLALHETSVYLLVDIDDNFANASVSGRAQEVTLTLNGDYFEGTVDFVDNDFFTFATNTNQFPASVTTNLQLWYDSSDIDGDFDENNNPADGTAVTTWVDKVGGNNATLFGAATGAIVETDPAEQINGHPVLKFNAAGNSSIYETPLDIRADTTEDLTIFAVYKPKNTTAIQQAIWGNDDGAWDRFFYPYFQSFGDGIDDGIVGVTPAGKLIPDAGKIDEVYLQTTAYDGNVVGASNNGPAGASTVYFNGEVVSTFTDNSHPSNAVDKMHIGWDGDGGAFDGQMAEMIIYDRILEECEIEQINSYLGDKYGRDFGGIASAYGLGAPHINNVNGIGILPSDCGGDNQINSMFSAELFIDNPSSNDTLNETLTFGNDGGTVGIPSTNVPGTFQARQGRAWRADEDGDIGTVDAEFDLAALGLTDQGVDKYALLIDTDDGDFSNATVYPGSDVPTTGYTYANNKVKFLGIDFTNGDYFAIAVADTSQPTVTVEQAAGQADPETTNMVVNFTATFSEPIDPNTFGCSDVTIGGTATATCTAVTEVSGQNVYNLEITTTTNGTVTASLAAGVSTDVVGNLAQVSTSTDNSVTVNVTIPPSPGGVSSDLTLWLKADEGTATTTNGVGNTDWTNQAPGGASIPSTGASDPVYVESALNFNPAINFNGVDNLYAGLSNYGVSGTDLFTTFAVQNRSDNVGLDMIWSENTAAAGAAQFYVSGNATSIDVSGTGPKSGGTVHTPGVYGITGLNRSAADTWQLLHNGANDGTSGSVGFGGTLLSGNLNIGSGNGTFFHEGPMAEVIIHSASLTNTEMQQIQSYLALKYGITLDQTSSTNYLASDGTTEVWDAGQNVNYKFDIAGIGQDDDSTLDQKISKSVNDDALVTMATTNNFTLPNTDGGRTSLGDGNFLTWSNNDGLTSLWTTTGAPDTQRIVTKKWQVQETGTVGTVNIRVPASTASDASKLPAHENNVYLLVDIDDNFADLSGSGRDQAITMTLNGDYFEATVNFVDNDFFTFATDENNFPGSVKTGNKFWLDASDIDGDGVVEGFSEDGLVEVVAGSEYRVDAWADKALHEDPAHGVSQSSANARPQLVLDEYGTGVHTINFEKTGTADYLENLTPDWTDDFTSFIVFQATSPGTLTNNDAFFSNHNSPDDDSHQIDYDGTASFRMKVDDLNFSTNYAPASSELNLYTSTVEFTGGNTVVTTYGDGELANTNNFAGDKGRHFRAYRVNLNRGGNKSTDAKISEFIIYDRILNACEIEQVNTYLGEKYGRDFSGVYNNYSFGAPYNNSTSGIGIQASGCGGNNQINSMFSDELFVDNASSNDVVGEFLTFGNDGAAVGIPSTNVPAGYQARQGKAWRADEDGGLGTVDATFDLAALGLTDQGIDNYALLIDTDDGDFSNATVYPGSDVPTTGYTYANNKIKFLGVDFTHGDYFAIAVADTSQPTVTVDQGGSQLDPETVDGAVTFTAIFSEPIDPNTFGCGDVTIGGTATATCTSVTEVSGQTNYDIVITSTTDGTVTASLAAGVSTDVVGNLAQASTSTDNSVTISGVFDATKPDVTIDKAASQADPTDTSPIVFTAVFSEAINVASFVALDLDTSTSTATGITIDSITEVAPNDGTTFEITISVTGDGDITLTLPAGRVEDLATNSNNVSTSTDNTITFNTADDDGDGISDVDEAAICTNFPAIAACTGADPETGIGPDTDTDGDGIPDVTEVENGNDPTDGDDPIAGGDNDTDGDGVTDGIETSLCADFPALISCGGVAPSTGVTLITDGDGDGVPDWLEYINGSDPTDGDDPVVGGDGGDGIGGNPSTDTDNDGISDAVETALCALYPDADNCPTTGTSITPTQDTDGDGIPDVTELLNGSDPTDVNDPTTNGGGDDDGDGISNAVEQLLEDGGGQTAPNTTPSTDTDGDGIPDATEVANGSDPFDDDSPTLNGDIDSDGDGISNAVEQLLEDGGGQTAPNTTPATDTDGDGIPDATEVANGSDPFDGDDPTTNGGGDDDGDGVSNAVEQLLEDGGGQTAPNTTPSTDTDGDGIPDTIEIATGSDPFDADSPVVDGDDDSDGDGVPDAIEDLVESQGGPAAPGVTLSTDTDGDGIPDVIEVITGSDPTDGDSPVPGGDGGGTTPLDSDGDGVPDALEVALCDLYPAVDNCPATTGTEILALQDTDGDGTADIIELQTGSDPTDGNDPSAGGGGGVTALDTDSDGIPDTLEDNMCVLYPTLDNCAGGTDGTQITPTQDTDGDGIPDYLEVLNGLDPTVNPGGTPATDDDDGDGVSNLEEMEGNNGGDGNGDGTPDILQSQVASVTNQRTRGSVTLESQGADCSVIDNAAGLREAQIGNDANYNYPVGIFDFTLSCDNPGDSTTMKIYLDEQYDTSDWVLRKYDSSTGTFSSIDAVITAVPANEVIGDETITNGIESGSVVTSISYEIQDGDALDEDGAPNAVILDPIGPAVFFATVTGGSAAVKNYPVGVCHKEKKQCVNIFPTQSNSADSTYSDYQACIKSSATKTPSDCTKDWAEANLYKTCGTDNECPVPTADAAFHLLQNAIKGATDLAEQIQTDTAASFAVKSDTDSCEREIFARSREGVLPVDYFTDSDYRNPAYEYAVDLGIQGVISGDDETHDLRIDETIARGEIAKVLSRAAEHEVVYGEDCLDNLFPDVVNQAWYHRYVANMHDRSIVSGYPDGQFRPGRDINKVELYKMAAITFGLITEEEAEIQAYSQGLDWYVPYVRAIDYRVDTPSWFDEVEMDKAVTRGEVFALVSLLLAEADGLTTE